MNQQPRPREWLQNRPKWLDEEKEAHTASSQELIAAYYYLLRIEEVGLSYAKDERDLIAVKDEMASRYTIIADSA